MLKIIDVDVVAPYTLELTFNDGLAGQADLSDVFTALEAPIVFEKFALDPDGSLRWSHVRLSPEELKDLTVGSYHSPKTITVIEEIEGVIKDAAWESIQEGRPDILQATIRAYVEYYGHQKVIEKAGIKSRTSAYRSLKPDTTPNFGTLVQLGHAVIELAQEN